MGKPSSIRSIDKPIVVGSGIAGLSTALNLGRCLVITKGGLASGSSDHAQGGIAAAIAADDSASLHAGDTVAVGGGMVDELIARMVAVDAPARITWLREIGTLFDAGSDGRLLLGREAGHSRHRIVHANGDATGRAVMEALRSACLAGTEIEIAEHTELIDLVWSRGRVAGVVSEAGGELDVTLAPAVVLATGGIGRLYARTTNPPESTGDGLAAALRAGAAVQDMEFVQFHPTALDGPTDPLPLLTEALRGAGASLADEEGSRFMARIHPDAEMAPRDIVARAVWRNLDEGRGAYLDLSRIDALRDRFPSACAVAEAAGFEPETDPLPVVPAAHYHMGGVLTDTEGRTSLDGLYACGEVAATGLHGANRLASNSLLEGLVFSVRVAAAIGVAGALAADADLHIPQSTVEGYTGDTSEAIAALRSLMWNDVGLQRSAAGLKDAARRIRALGGELASSQTGRNLAIVAEVITDRGLQRRESRGSHYRVDHPQESTRARSSITVRPKVPSRRLAAAGAGSPDGS